MGAVVVIGTLWSATTSVTGQSLPPREILPTTYTAPRTPDGRPDLNGFWQAVNSANWDIEEHQAKTAPYEKLVGTYLAQPPGFSVVVGGVIPYKPEMLEKRKKLFDNRLKPKALAPDNLQTEDAADPEAKCFQGGVPRATYMPFPFQILQSKNKVFLAYTFGGASFRIIHLDKTDFSTLLQNPTWNGQSIGHWEGETLVVETKWFNTTVWLDRAANFYHENAVVIERYTATSPYHLKYEATINDPTVFTRPWTISMPLYRLVEPPTQFQLLEFQCIGFSDEFLYGDLKKGVFVPPRK